MQYINLSTTMLLCKLKSFNNLIAHGIHFWQFWSIEQCVRVSSSSFSESVTFDWYSVLFEILFIIKYTGYNPLHNYTLHS